MRRQPEICFEVTHRDRQRTHGKVDVLIEGKTRASLLNYPVWELARNLASEPPYPCPGRLADAR